MIESASENDLVIVSYQLLQRDAKRFASRAWHTLVLDERSSSRTHKRKHRRQCGSWKLIENWASGTPFENHLGELWSLFRTISPRLLGSWERFRTRFADPIERHKDDERRQSLARLVRPFIVRRTKDTVLKELPPHRNYLAAELSSEERKRYEDIRLAALAELRVLEKIHSRQGKANSNARVVDQIAAACLPSPLG